MSAKLSVSRRLSLVALVLVCAAAGPVAVSRPSGLATPGAGAAHLIFGIVSPTTGIGTLYLSSVNGRGRHLVAQNGAWPHLSPDGRYLLYFGPEGLWLLNLRSGARTLATVDDDGYHAAWAPDSKHFGYVTKPPCVTCLSTVQIATPAAPTAVVGSLHGPPQAGTPSFSPDGTRVVFSVGNISDCLTNGNGQFIYEGSVSGGPLKRLTSDGCSSTPVWGPHGIAFSRCTTVPDSQVGTKFDCQIWMMAPNGGGQKQITSLPLPNPFLEGLSPIAWSKNGSRLLARLDGEDTIEAYGVDVPSGKTWDLSSPRQQQPAGISKDGRYVITLGFSGGDGPAYSTGLYQIPFHGGPRTLLVAKAGEATWNR